MYIAFSSFSTLIFDCVFVDFSSSSLNSHIKISFDAKFCFAFLHLYTSFHTFIEVSYVGLFIELSETELLNNIRS